MNLCVLKSEWRWNNYPASNYGDDHMVFEDKNCDERGQLYWSEPTKEVYREQQKEKVRTPVSILRITRNQLSSHTTLTANSYLKEIGIQSFGLNGY